VTTKRGRVGAFIVTLIVGGFIGGFLGARAQHLTLPPAPVPTPKTAVPLCAAPPTLVAGGVYQLSGCVEVPAAGITVPAGVTIDGGAFVDSNVQPCPYARCAPGSNRGRPAFLVKTSGVTLENLSVTGANVGGFHEKLAFNAGIELEGSSGTTISHVSISHVFGDCLDLEPQRSGTGSNGVVAPVSGLAAVSLSATACGRNGVTCASVNGASFTDLTIGSTGQDDVDCEADERGGEGAKNLTITGASWNGLTSINAGGESTGPITINGLTMSGAGSGDALQVQNRDGSKPAGAITIENSTIRCGESSYLACLTMSGANVVMSNDAMSIGFDYPGSLRSPVYHAAKGAVLTFSGTTVTGRYKPGTVDKTSKVVNPIGVVL
jgi:hypothetical protein